MCIRPEEVQMCIRPEEVQMCIRPEEVQMCILVRRTLADTYVRYVGYADFGCESGSITSMHARTEAHQCHIQWSVSTTNATRDQCGHRCGGLGE
jgi:hypothetical protein